MYKPLILIVLLLSSSFAVLDASSIGTDEEEQYVMLPNETNEEKPRQQGINYIPFKEVATVVIDQTTDKITKSYTLMSKDNKDFRIPDSLEAKILNKEIISIVYTNTERCTLGVIEATCIMINIEVDDSTEIEFKEKQKMAREIGDSVIDDINQALGTITKYHSTAIQSNNDLTGSEKATFSVTYTMYYLPAKLLFNMLILESITEEIRNAGGFFNNAKMLTEKKNSVFTFSMIPEKQSILHAVQISSTSPGTIGLGNLSPLDILIEDELNRSKLFMHGHYPLNSIVNILIFSEEKLQVLGTYSQIVGSIPENDSMQKNGWYYIKSEQIRGETATSDSADQVVIEGTTMADVFSADEVYLLDLRYLFGKTNSVSKEQLLLSVNPVIADVVLSDTPQNDVSQNGGGCLIATATFGSEMAPQVQFLRELRDNTVLQTESGTNFMTGFSQFYYTFSPAVADYERENPTFKETVKIALTPLLTSLTLLQYADIDSESEMLGYGIGIILLNIGMYFVAPAVLVMKIRKLI